MHVTRVVGAADPMQVLSCWREVRLRDPFVPLILQSAEVDNKVYASRYGAKLVDKNSKKMNIDLLAKLCLMILVRISFSVIPTISEESGRVHNLKELQNVIFAIPKNLSFTISVVITYPAGCMLLRARSPAEFLSKYSVGLCRILMLIAV